jgi:ABC transporter substrate binding protein (PQQ-dependent alcohol dehydrogenase system)
MNVAHRHCRRGAPRLRQRMTVVAVAAAAVALAAFGGAAAQAGPGDALYIGVIIPAAPEGDGRELVAAVARAAEQGARMAEEEHAFNAELFGIEFEVLIEQASGGDAVVVAAERLVDESGAFAIAGGFSDEEALALGAWAQERNVPFLNVAAQSDALRNELCFATTYHVEPSAAMYLDALAGWYVRSGFRRWHVVVDDGEASAALRERMLWSLRERHFGAREEGRSEIVEGAATDGLPDAIRRSNADLIVLLVGPDEQLRITADLEQAGVTVPVAGFPHPETQTRTFYDRSRTGAPVLGSDHRAASWEATLDAYGAREINARFLAEFGDPMEPTAWSTYQAVKILFEAATLGGAVDPDAVMAFIDGGVFDIWKGIGASFRSWDRQLRQSLYLVNINSEAVDPFDMVILVGELPAIYMPGTDPVERLDQLGDMRERSRCRL